MNLKPKFHHFSEWECHAAGMYAPQPALKKKDLEQGFANYFVENDFRADILELLKDWPNSCENFLSNKSMNRVAWLGQACVFRKTGISMRYRRGYTLLPEDVKKTQDAIAEEAIKAWEENYVRAKLKKTTD